MNRLFILLALNTFILTSCTKSEEYFTPEQAQKRADSIYNLKAKIIKDDAQKNLEIRKKTELKERVDNIRYGPKNEIYEPADKKQNSLEQERLELPVHPNQNEILRPRED